MDAAVVDDDAAIRVLNNNIDTNGTGVFILTYSLSSVAAMLANLIQDGVYFFRCLNRHLTVGFRARGDIFVGNLFSLYDSLNLCFLPVKDSGLGRFVLCSRKPEYMYLMAPFCSGSWVPYQRLSFASNAADETNSLRGYWKESYVALSYLSCSKR